MYPAHKNSNDKPRPISVISVCSGIGTDAVAWHPLGWKHLCFAEIEKFPSAVLAHHWPHVINRGDFTKIGDEYLGAADLLVGGTPCQSFSVAGLRGGLADDRGNLALEFLRLADRTRPRWVVWENVPGVLSSDGGRDFGSIIGGLGKLGYGWAYRILDAQYFGVPQRRRRVFVVGHLGDWRSAAAVLFERHSLQGNHPPRREKGQGFTHELAPSLTASGRGVERSGDSRGQDPIVAGAVSSKWAKGTGGPGVMTQAAAVRRLTPRECERLQGLPDDYTLVPFSGKPAADGPRYKAIGNGMAMPVLRWIGERIALVESLVQP